MITFQNVSFGYGKLPIFRDLSFTVGNGELLAVVGPSGCGKTTLLNLASGLYLPQKGQIQTDAERVSYVFQEPRLFPWLTVEENIAAVMADPKSKIGQEKIRDLLHAVSLSDRASAFPDALSGGMKSRVSLARAFAYGGQLFLLDEPFAALDEELRYSLWELFLEYLRKNRPCAILVTHQRAEAERFADRILELPLTTSSDGGI